MKNILFSVPLLTILLAIVNTINACPFSDKISKNGAEFTEEERAHGEQMRRRLTTQITHATCASTSATCISNKANTCAAYSGLKVDFAALNASTVGVLNRAKIWGAAVRLVFHDAGEYSQLTTDLLGADGCLATIGDNAGLIEDTSQVFLVIEPLWQKYCGLITRADFWVLFGTLVIGAADITGYMAPRLPYSFGRKDVANCDAGAGRLPDASRGRPALIETFVDRMGLSLNDAAVLMGAHTLGHVHIANSGYGFPAGSATDPLNNAWDLTPDIFDNQFYKSLLTVNWYNELAPNGMAQWMRHNQPSIMLNTDMIMSFTPVIGDGTGSLGQVCGPTGLTYLGQNVPPGVSTFGCSPENAQMPDMCSLTCRYANDQTFFFNRFIISWNKMISVGYGGPPAAADGSLSPTGGKLGRLTSLDLTTCPA